MKSVKQDINEHFVSVLIIIGRAYAYIYVVYVCVSALHAYWFVCSFFLCTLVRVQFRFHEVRKGE